MMLKCCWNDLKINRSAGFQNADLTKVVIGNGTGRWKGNRKGIDETSHYIAPYFTLSPLQGWKKIGKCKVEILLLSNELSEKRHYAVCRYLLKSNHL